MLNLEQMTLVRVLSDQKREAALRSSNGRRTSSMSEGSTIRVWFAGFVEGLSFTDRSGESTPINGAPAVLLYTRGEVNPESWEAAPTADGGTISWPTAANKEMSALFLNSLVAIPVGFEQTTNILLKSMGGYEKGYCSPSQIPDYQEAFVLLPGNQPGEAEAHPEFWCPKKWQFREDALLLEPLLRELLYEPHLAGECPHLKPDHGGLMTQLAALQSLITESGKLGNSVEVNGEAHPYLQLTARWSPGMYRTWNYRRHLLGDVRQILSWEVNLPKDTIMATLYPEPSSPDSSKKKGKK